MSIFLSFTILGLAIFLIAVATRPPVPKDPSQPLQFFEAVRVLLGKVCPGDPLLRWVATVIVATVALFLPVFWISWDLLRKADSPETPFQEFLGSRYMGSAAFGLLFGILFGYWLSSVLFREREKSPSYGEIVSGVLMAILLVLGLAGQNALSTVFTRLNSLEIGGAKFGFAEATGLAKSPTALANNPSKDGAALNAPDQSYGLTALIDLPSTIERDAHYARLFAKVGGNKGLADKIFTELSDVRNSADATIKPLADCLGVYVAETGDDGRVGRLLENIAAHLRGYVRNHESPPTQPPRWEGTFWKRAADILGEAPAAECVGLRQMLGKKREDLLKPLENPGWKDRPYLAISYASMLAYEHQYVAAIESLDQWIIDHGEPKISDSEEQKIKARVFKARVRNLIATYLEEWLRGTYGIQTRSVLTYHIMNLDALVREMATDFDPLIGDTVRQMRLRNNPMIDSQFARAPADDGACPISSLSEESGSNNPPLSDPKLRLMLIRTLIAAKLMWINVVLDHPDYLQKYASMAEARADELLRLDLSCLRTLGADGVATKRAESLDAFARVLLANRTGTETLKAILNRDKTRQDLELALAAVSLGQQIIGSVNKVSSEKSKAVGFLAAIAAKQSDDTLDGLKRTERRLRSALE
jgi:hypothetical protein